MYDDGAGMFGDATQIPPRLLRRTVPEFASS